MHTAVGAAWRCSGEAPPAKSLHLPINIPGIILITESAYGETKTAGGV